MEYNDIASYVSEKGGRLIGYYPISFPVYSVHVTYDSIDNDPFFPVYRAILKYTQIDPKHDSLSYFSQVIGFERTMIDDCKKKLRDDAMIRFVGDKWVLTDNAISKYLQPGNRSTVRVSGTFLVDGKDLSFLPKIIYSNKFKFFKGYKPKDAGTHKPIDMSMSTAPAEAIENQLERKPQIRKMLRLDTAGSNFKVIDFEKRYLQNLYLVFYLNQDNKICKDSVYLGEKIECPAIGEISGYSIELKLDDKGQYCFKSNLGYNVSRLEDAVKTVLFSKTEGWNHLIAERYYLDDSVPIRIEIEEQTNLPSIVLDHVLAINTKFLRRMVEDAAIGHIPFEILPSGNVYISVKSEIDNYVALYKDVKSWIHSHQMSAQDFYQHLSIKYKGWRETLVRLEMYDQLERIDSECFILNR